MEGVTDFFLVPWGPESAPKKKKGLTIYLKSNSTLEGALSFFYHEINAIRAFLR